MNGVLVRKRRKEVEVEEIDDFGIPAPFNCNESRVDVAFTHHWGTGD